MPMRPRSSAVVAAMTMSHIVNARGAAAASGSSCSVRTCASARLESIDLTAARAAFVRASGGVDVRTTYVMTSIAGQMSRVANIGTYIFGTWLGSVREMV